MKILTDPKTFDDGRQQQFEVMMERVAALQAKYGGVRGELLAKVWAELMETRPTRGSSAAAPSAEAATPAQATPPAGKPSAAKRGGQSKLLPSCRVCGRGMRQTPEGTLVCERGHTRVVA